MNFDIKSKAKEKVIITAHRGYYGGNIPCNTLAAYEIALKHGADMIETDANRSAEGTLWILHPKMERCQLGIEGRYITSMTDREIRELRYLNTDRERTQYGLCTLEELLCRFKDRCFINIDKFWTYPEEISDMIRKHDMQSQIIVKTAPEKEYLDIIENYASELQYLPIIKSEDGHRAVAERNINYVGAEIIFPDDGNELISPRFIKMMKDSGRLVWMNAIVYNYKAVLAANHSDDESLVNDPDNGWGWLVRHGADIIQTDFPLAINLYLKEKGLLYR